MECYTIQMAKHRVVDKTKMVFLDTTVKSGERWLAPKWDMVLGHKNRSVSNEQYTKQFREMMNISQETHKEKWDSLFTIDLPIVFACYCPCFNFCHRYLLIEILAEYALKHQIPFTYLGEYRTE